MSYLCKIPSIFANMRRNVLTYVLLIVLILMLFGIVSFGDVVSVVFYIFMAILILVLTGVLFFRWRINRIKREVQKQAKNAQSQYRNYQSGSGRGQQKRPDGEITVQRTAASRTRVVRNDIGSYVEYEEIEEEETNSN